MAKTAGVRGEAVPIGIAGIYINNGYICNRNIRTAGSFQLSDARKLWGRLKLLLPDAVSWTTREAAGEGGVILW
jgi:hypothetical protein